MIQRQRTVQAAALLASDLLTTTLAFVAAYWLRFGYRLVPVKDRPGDVPTFASYLPLLIPFLALLPVVMAAFGLYRLRRTNARAEQYLRVVVAVFLTMALVTAVAFGLYRPTDTVAVDGRQIEVARFPFSRLALVLFFVFDIVGVLGGRVAIQRILDRLRRSGRNLKRVLIAGTGSLARTVVDKVRLHEEFGFRIVGLLSGGDDEGSYRGVPVIGDIDDASDIVRDQGVDQLYIALPLSAHQEILDLIRDVSNEIDEVKVVPDLLQYITLRAGTEDLDGVPVINLSRVPLQGVGSLVKRGLDIVAAGACILLFAPIFPVVALAVHLSSEGPILYRQKRMGLDGRSFTLYKFRSMVADAESETGPVWTEEEDPRITAVGKVIRKFSLDELPQFWNVLRGDMSLVGPRPERPYFVEEFRQRIPHYMLRHRVRAGMTGWAQVHGWRGNTSLEKRIEYDLYYIENWSMALDLKILWMTVTNGLGHEHAY